jgi:hypothetical protein
MPTILSFLSGRQITNDSGVPQSGAKLLHYRETTTTALTVWQDEAGTVAHAQPVVCDAGGFVPLIYADDTFDWKVVITTSADVTLKTYDELAKAESAVSAAGFAPPLFPWTQVTSAGSPVALTAADAGKAYEADTTGGNIEFDLPSAASVGDGKGFLFKKTAAANSMIIDPSGSETIDDVSTSLTVTRQYQVVAIFSNGAEWYVAWQYLEDVASGRTFVATDSAPGVLIIATQAEMESAASAFRTVTPGRQHFHPGMAKCWAVATYSAGVPSLTASYNITGITDDGVGLITITIATDFSSADWAAHSMTRHSTDAFTVTALAQAAGSIQLSADVSGSGNVDPTKIFLTGFGDQ